MFYWFFEGMMMMMMIMMIMMLMPHQNVFFSNSLITCVGILVCLSCFVTIF